VEAGFYREDRRKKMGGVLWIGSFLLGRKKDLCFLVLLQQEGTKRCNAREGEDFQLTIIPPFERSSWPFHSPGKGRSPLHGMEREECGSRNSVCCVDAALLCSALLIVPGKKGRYCLAVLLSFGIIV
jgi:hypothetical protein